jgi:hypothetical protein
MGTSLEAARMGEPSACYSQPARHGTARVVTPNDGAVRGRARQPEGRACGEARRRASGGAEGDGGSVNLETLYGAIGDGAIAVRILKHARKELEAHPGCGLLCRGLRG